MIAIFQVIGKPDSYQEVEYLVGGRVIRARVSGRAVSMMLGEGSRLFLLAPESVENGSVEEFARENEAKLLWVPAYHSSGDGCCLEVIVTSILLHMLEEEPEELYVDVSTGLNVYTVALVEAARRYLTYSRLRGIVQNRKGAEVKMISSSPVINKSQRVSTEIEGMEVKAFFSYPEVRIGEVLRGSENRELYVRLKGILKELRIAYNALRLNVPLTFYTPEVLSLDEDIGEVMKELKGVLRIKIEQGGNFSGKEVAKVFYALAMYHSLQEFMHGLTEPEVEEIKRVFLDTYRIDSLGIGSNTFFLTRDLEELKNLGEELEEGEEETLQKLRERKRECGGGAGGSTDRKRNFFAHSGLLREYTVVRKEGGKLFLRWRTEGEAGKEVVREIRRWLLSP